MHIIFKVVELGLQTENLWGQLQPVVHPAVVKALKGMKKQQSSILLVDDCDLHSVGTVFSLKKYEVGEERI